MYKLCYFNQFGKKIFYKILECLFQSVYNSHYKIEFNSLSIFFSQSTDQSNTENQITQNAEPFQQLPNLAQLMDFLQPVHNQLPPLSLPTLQTPLKSYMRNSPIQKPARGKRGQYR